MPIDCNAPNHAAQPSSPRNAGCADIYATFLRKKIMRRKLAFLILIGAVVGVVAYGFELVGHGVSAKDQPSSIEKLLARTMRDLAIPREAKEQKNPWGNPPAPEAVFAGRVHWADHCATCHGNDGSGDTLIGQNLYPKAPDMRLPATQNLTDGELYYIIVNGVRLTGMPAWGLAGSGKEDELAPGFLHPASAPRHPGGVGRNEGAKPENRRGSCRRTTGTGILKRRERRAEIPRQELKS